MHATRLPADELALIRTQIHRLKAREAQLNAAFLEGSSEEVHSEGGHAVELVETEQQVFVPARLPAHIRQDPRYYEMRRTTHVQLRRKAGTVAG